MKKLMAVLLSAAVVASLFSGCSSKSSSQSTSGKTYNLSYWALFSGGEGDAMNKLVTDFNSSHKNIQVKITELEWDPYYTKLEAAVAAGKGPDIGVSHITKLPELVKGNYIYNVDDYAKAVGVKWSNYTDNFMTASTFNGKHYSIPIDTHCYAIFYNKTMLKAAGMVGSDGKPNITPGNNGQGFIDYLVALKSKLPSGKFALAETEKGDDVYRFWFSIYNQLGGKNFISADGKTCKIDTEKAVKAINYMKDLWTKYKVIPENLDNNHFPDQFQNQNAALMLNGVWSIYTMANTNGLDFGVIPFPKLFDNASAWGDSHNLILPKQKNLDKGREEAALTFMNWVAENGAIWGQAGHIPAYTPARESSAYTSLPGRSDLVNAVSSVVFPSQSAQTWPCKQIIYQNLETVLNGSVQPDAAFKTIEEQINKQLKS
jgi:multiple sugar transport system substrate-binding protein